MEPAQVFHADHSLGGGQAAADGGGTRMAAGAESALQIVAGTAHANAAARAPARAQECGGDAGGECGSVTLVRNGTGLECDTCGSTAGCS